jgi:sugar phosphate permease
MSFHNTSHNLGAGFLPLLVIGSQIAFSFIGDKYMAPQILSIILSLVMSGLVLIYLRDTPESLGLHPVEY